MSLSNPDTVHRYRRGKHVQALAVWPLGSARGDFVFVRVKTEASRFGYGEAAVLESRIHDEVLQEYATREETPFMVVHCTSDGGPETWVVCTPHGEDRGWHNQEPASIAEELGVLPRALMSLTRNVAAVGGAQFG